MPRTQTGIGRESLRPGWHREAVGGLWDEVGTLQRDFMIARGLRPEHRLLDVGCGSLRGGIRFIEYLDAGNYVGVDRDPELLEAGRVELAEAGLESKGTTLVHDEHFRFGHIGGRFDYALAQSLFTHLPLNSVMVCLLGVEAVLREGGTFYATFFERPQGTRGLGAIEHERADGPAIRTRPDADPYHYGFDAFEWICEPTRLEPRYIGEWGHPRGQRMLAFVRRG